LAGVPRYTRSNPEIGTVMARALEIGDRLIGDGEPCFVIAEIGHNHGGSLDTCKELFRAAAECGADAVKLQKRVNRTLFTRQMYESVYNSENAYAPTYGEHREKLEFGFHEYRELQELARELGILFFATAFDAPSADFLEALDMPCYKIASGDLTNTPLLRHVAGFGKPMLISTGGAHMEDVQRAYEVVAPINRHLCIMQCTAAYPARHEELNLRVIETYRRAFPDTVIGFSSHDNGIAMPLIAYMLGARVIEKHFTLDRTWKGTDQAFSLERPGLRRVVRDLARARAALGDGLKRPFESERPPLHKMAKKLVAAADLPRGHILRPEDIAIRSPNDGTPPWRFDDFVGKPLSAPVAADENLSEKNVRLG